MRKKIAVYIEILRPFNLVTPAVLGATGVIVGTKGLPSAILLLVAIIVPILGWGAGQIANDFLDRKLDKINAAHRPIPSRRIQKDEVYMLSASLAITGLLFALVINITAFLFALLGGLVSLAYSSYFKQKGLLGNLCCGCGCSLCFLLGGVIANSPFSCVIILIAVAIGLEATSINLIGTFKDVEGDKTRQIKSLAVMFGMRKSSILAMSFSFLGIIFACVPAFLKLINPNYLYIIGLSTLFITRRYFKLFNNLTVKGGYYALKDAITNTGIFFPAFMAGYLPLIYVSSLVIILVIFTELLQRHFIEQFVVQ